jgi:hypothetical protein
MPQYALCGALLQRIEKPTVAGGRHGDQVGFLLNRCP